MDFSFFSDKGRIRENNEDSYYYDPKKNIFAVADGMGGHIAGEVASKLAVEVLANFSFEPYDDYCKALEEMIHEANSKIIDYGENNPDYQGMGTTFSTGIINNKTLYYAHIGDSRIYFFRNGESKQLTRDHSYVNQLVEKNEITEEEAFDHEQKNILTQALGTDSDININKGTHQLQTGDLLLFCTDGLTDMLRKEEITNYIKDNCCDPAHIATLLGEKALERGGKDNITLLVVLID